MYLISLATKGCESKLYSTDSKKQSILLLFSKHIFSLFFINRESSGINKYIAIPRDGILVDQLNKRLESFAPCYSQSLLLADFKEKIYSSLVLKILTKKIREKRNLESIHV